MTKDDHTLRSLSKIKHKQWELYVISRIIHRLDDPISNLSASSLCEDQMAREPSQISIFRSLACISKWMSRNTLKKIMKLGIRSDPEILLN